MIAYETTIVLRSDITDSTQKALLDKIKTIIQNDGGQVIATEDWGRRKLAYPINKETKAVYAYLIYSAKNSTVAEIERNLRISEDVLRFLSVKICDDFETKKFKRKPTPNVLREAAAPQPAAHAAH